jgi:hypothetical protein
MVKKSFRLIVLSLVASLFACANTTPNAQVDSNSSTASNSTPSQTAEVTGTQPTTTEAEINFQAYSKEQPAGYIDAINDAPSQTNLTVPAGQPIILNGWAILPDGSKPADKIIVTVGDEKVIAPTEVQRYERPDISKAYKNDDLVKSGWITTIDSTKLSGSQVSLQAWSYDAATKKAYPINEPITVTIK